MKQIATTFCQKTDSNVSNKIPVGAHAENVIVQVKDEITGEVSTVNLQYFLDNLEISPKLEWADYL